MLMRFCGGGVGHKSMREVTDQFLVDHDPMDICLGQQEHSDEEEEEDDVEPMEEDADGEENEEDYGYSDADTDLEWEDVDERFTNLLGLDLLGAEDGVDITDLAEDLGFTEL